MKKLLLLATSALLLLAGCAKDEQIQGVQESGDQTVTFSVGLENTATKAVQDGDGAAAKINHWVMEVRDSDGEVFARKDESGDAGVKNHTFQVKLVKGQAYNVLFWADSAGVYNTDDLTNVTLASTTGYVANLDGRDAFSAVFPIASATTLNENITLKRPFGQLNIIFTDLKALREGMISQDAYLKYRPNTLKVTAKVPTSFNVQTQTAGDPATTALNITADSDYAGNYATHRTEETIFMDYFFATAGTKDVVDLGFSFVSNNVEIAHSFNSVPFQRNYRTNIKGELMTAGATWNVTIDPTWESGATGTDDIMYEVVKDIADANTIIASEIASGKTDISVKFTEQPNDAGVPGATTGNAILTTNLPEDSKLNILVEAQTKELYIGDYVSQTSTEVQTSGTNAAVVNVNIPANSGILKLVINASSKTVYVNGIEVDSGVITDLDAITSYNTMIISKDQTVTNLKIRQGALEIHGTVGTASVEVAQGKNVYVRDCEGLSQSVYDVLKPYIDVDNGYVGEQESDKDTYRVYQKGEEEKVAKIGDTKYYTLNAAFNAATTGQTIELLKNCSATSTITVDKTVKLDLKTYTLTAACSGFLFNLNATETGKTFKIIGTDAENCGHIASNGTEGHSGVACINASSSAVTLEMDYVKVHGATESDAYTAGSVIISDNSTERTDQINLTEVSINGNQDLVSGSAGRAYASINVKGGIYSTSQRGFRFCGAADSESVIDGVNLTTGGGIAVYAFSTTTLKDSEVNMTSGNDAVSCSRYYNDDAVLTITNTKVTTQGNSAVAAESLGVVNINSGEFSNDNNDKNVIKVSTSSGTININGGTVKAKSSTQVTLFTNTDSKSEPDPDAAIYVNGGEIYGKAGVSSDHAFIVINGGTFKNDFTLYEGGTQYIRIAAESSAVFEGKVISTTAVTIPAGTFKKAIAENDLASGSTITGGTFYEAAPYSAYIKSGYEAKAQGTDPETWKIVELPSVAVIGTTKYQTLAAAFSAVKNGETIKMTDNTEVSSTITIASGTVTLDLNGKTITSTASGTCFWVKGKLIVLDSNNNDNGKLTTTTTENLFKTELASSGLKIDIKNGTFEQGKSSGYIINNYPNLGAGFSISGGHFILKNTAGSGYIIYSGESTYNHTITGGTFESSAGSSKLIHINGMNQNNVITISGGTFTQTGNSAYCFMGYWGTTWNITGGTYSCDSGYLMYSMGCKYNISGDPTFNVNSATVLYCNKDKSNTITISGGTFTASSVGEGGKIFQDNTTQPIQISGGTFNAGMYYNKSHNVFWTFNGTTPNIIVSGGTFNENPAAADRTYDATPTYNLVKSGYKSTSNGGSPETWTVTEDVK